MQQVMSRKIERKMEQKRKHRAGMKASALILFRIVTLAASNISLNVVMYHIGLRAKWNSSQYILASIAVGILTVFVAIALFYPAAFRKSPPVVKSDDS